ncbi:zinc finger BED domain-containing protein RICESLEEPER 2-like [Phragmites australis]|uniref:zinc finger BED domain-containing protein RICESLEEPER 2-like n=1 Tax=Phragmites australis TaxID=29695 RepID=UPI002D78B587|nr:zinc finger BED domain-containing protein RICESLEEPER 2-like [Phragmites australis]
MQPHDPLSLERVYTSIPQVPTAPQSPRTNRSLRHRRFADMASPSRRGLQAAPPPPLPPFIDASSGATPSRRPHLHVPATASSARPPTSRPPAQRMFTGSSSSAAAGSPSLKRKVPSVKQINAPQAKRFMSPIVPMAVRSPGIKIMLSPRVGSPSTSLARSPSPIPISPSSRSSCRNRRRKLTSKIWTEFEPIYDGQTLVQAKCIHCSRIFKANRDFGTSGCRRHLNSCEGKSRFDHMRTQMNSNNLSLHGALKNWKFDQEVARQELIKLIVVHELPFSLVDYAKFRNFVASLNPWFTLVSRTTIKADCIDAYEEGKAALRKILQTSTSRVSLTADLWTSNQTLGYLCVTCHFINDNWRLVKRIIKFTLVETPHDGRNLFNAMLRTLQDWNIEDKVFAITVDNATVNDSFVTSLQENLVAKSLLLRKGKLFHYRCAAHVLNLIAQEGFKAMSGAIDNIRDSVNYVKSSQARKERFEKMVQQVGITCQKRPTLDVATRWNSTYEMLNSASEYKRAFEALTREDTQYVHEPSIEEWDMAKKLCSMLKVFYDATKEVSGSKYPTSSCYFHQIWEVKRMLDRESSNADQVIASMVHEMKEKFKKYWDLSFLKICIPVILDPRFKFGFLDFRLKKGFENRASLYLSEVQKTFVKLFAEYSSDSIYKNAQTVNDDELNVDESNPWADWGKHQSVQQTRRISELDEYLEEETVPIGVPFDILEFWKMNSTKYPTLACMARDLLAVPASTVAFESAFSTGERVINDYRSRLTSDTIEALICLQDWIRAKDSTWDNIAGNWTRNDGDDEI